MLTEIMGAMLAKMSPDSVRLCFAFVQGCINHAISCRLWQGANPLSTSRTSPFRLPRVDNAALRFLTRDEAKKLLAELKRRSVQQHDMALLSLKTGLRATEIS
jgi:integrase